MRRRKKWTSNGATNQPQSASEQIFDLNREFLRIYSKYAVVGEKCKYDVGGGQKGTNINNKHHANGVWIFWNPASDADDVA